MPLKKETAKSQKKIKEPEDNSSMKNLEPLITGPENRYYPFFGKLIAFGSRKKTYLFIRVKLFRIRSYQCKTWPFFESHFGKEQGIMPQIIKKLINSSTLKKSFQTIRNMSIKCRSVTDLG